MKKIIVVGGLIVSAWMMMPPTLAQAEVDVNIVVGEAPPPLSYEVVPSPRYGYVWVPGYWDWSGSEYTWHDGYWLADRAGYSYQTPYWYFGSGGWYRRPGGWHNHPYPAHNNPSERGATNWGYDWQHRQPRYETGRSPQQNDDRNRAHHQDHDRDHGQDHRRDQNHTYDRRYDRQYQSAPGLANPRASQPRNDADQRNGRDSYSRNESRNDSNGRPQVGKPGPRDYR